MNTLSTFIVNGIGDLCLIVNNQRDRLLFSLLDNFRGSGYLIFNSIKEHEGKLLFAYQCEEVE